MLFTPKEMEAICVFHSGTVSETLEMLRAVENETPERMALINRVIEKLSGMKEGETVLLAFEQEN